MLDTNSNSPTQDADGMLGHKLLEGDEEAGLDGDGALDGSITVTISAVMMDTRQRTHRRLFDFVSPYANRYKMAVIRFGRTTRRAMNLASSCSPQALSR